MTGTIFTFMQALQFSAILPCIFLAILLLAITRPLINALIPVSFFVILALSVMPGLPWLDTRPDSSILIVLMWLKSTLPALTFLLILQLWHNRVPHWSYAMILALPLLGGTPVIYATFVFKEVCLDATICVDSTIFGVLYQLFASCAIFLLLLVHVAGASSPVGQKERYANHRYWVIITLILSGVLLIANDFLRLTEVITDTQYNLITVTLRIALIYLVITSLFRLFDSKVVRSQPAHIDAERMETLEQLMTQEQVYREMGLNRDTLAAKLDVSEKKLSRMLNQELGKNFNEYVNHHRVQEAKQRLAQENTAITVIAFEVGFSSIASFNRVFKTLEGVSPSAYRAQHHTEDAPQEDGGV